MIVWGRSPREASEARESDSGSAGFGSDRMSLLVSRVSPELSGSEIDQRSPPK